MFDGNEQFHQFIASSRTSLPIPTLSFPLHGNSSFSAAFDSYSQPLQHHQPPTAKSDRSTDPWSNDELLALLKVRSGMEMWFPDFTWEHVSRKLGELGFNRSGEQCKEKFEEESIQLNSSSSKNYRILSELDEFYHPHEQEREKEVEEEEEDSRIPAESEQVLKKASKKRKRRDKLEMLKGFCETVVNKMMAKQEELHEKMIHDIVKRDEEKIAREEAWKNQEMDRIQAEIQTRSNEQKSAAERQAAIIEFLKQFTINANTNTNTDTNTTSNSNSSASFPQTDHHQEVETPSMIHQTHQNPSPCSTNDHHPPPVGRRWPRDEVLALINLRCRMSSNSNSNSGEQESKEGSYSKGPLWERISRGMMELGYKRNPKRCKEKWENINKYFRKTKDSSKKRSPNSRTCPYFHQLSCLYSDGTIVAPTAGE